MIDFESYWNSDHADEHRRGINDMEWASMQEIGEPEYAEGDIIEFIAGGFGIVKKISLEHDGWPASYSVSEVEGKPFHPRNICAWHYEGDIKGIIGKTEIRWLVD